MQRQFAGAGTANSPSLGPEPTLKLVLDNLLEVTRATRELKQNQQELRDTLINIKRRKISTPSASATPTSNGNQPVVFPKIITAASEPLPTIPLTSPDTFSPNDAQPNHQPRQRLPLQLQQLSNSVPRSMPAFLPPMYFSSISHPTPSPGCVIVDSAKPFVVLKPVRIYGHPGWGTIPLAANNAAFAVCGWRPVFLFFVDNFSCSSTQL